MYESQFYGLEDEQDKLIPANRRGFTLG